MNIDKPFLDFTSMNFTPMNCSVALTRNLHCDSPRMGTLPTKISENSKFMSQFTVDHSYHDHSSDNIVPRRRCAKGGVITPFPQKLHQVLMRMDEDGYGDIMSWQPHGRCFILRKPEEFSNLLQKYFNISKMASFQRQINLYGFSRLTQGPDKGGYYHELFLRGKPELSARMQRVRVKGTGVRKGSNPTAEPDFWSMTWVGKNGRVIQPVNTIQSAIVPIATEKLFQPLGMISQTPQTQEFQFYGMENVLRQEDPFQVSDEETESLLSELPLDGLLADFDYIPEAPERLLSAI